MIGPSEVTTSAQVVPKLLKLTWEGFPLYHSRELGWGYLVPGRPLDMCQNGGNGAMAFPLKDALSLFPPRTARQTRLTEGIITAEEALLQIKNMSDITADPVELATHWMVCLNYFSTGTRPSFYSCKSKFCMNSKASRGNLDPDPNSSEFQSDQSRFQASSKKKQTGDSHLTSDRPAWHTGNGPYDIGIPGCWFFRLPHKSGVENNVGNPLAKDYLNKIEDGTLKATSSSIAEHVLKLNRNSNFNIYAIVR